MVVAVDVLKFASNHVSRLCLSLTGLRFSGVSSFIVFGAYMSKFFVRFPYRCVRFFSQCASGFPHTSSCRFGHAGAHLIRRIGARDAAGKILD
jgi:hypothetical protein